MELLRVGEKPYGQGFVLDICYCVNQGPVPIKPALNVLFSPGLFSPVLTTKNVFTLNYKSIILI